jgi:hypothetical protein
MQERKTAIRLALERAVATAKSSPLRRKVLNAVHRDAGILKGRNAR